MSTAAKDRRHVSDDVRSYRPFCLANSIHRLKHSSTCSLPDHSPEAGQEIDAQCAPFVRMILVRSDKSLPYARFQGTSIDATKLCLFLVHAVRKLTDSERFLGAVPSIVGRRLTYAGLTGNVDSAECDGNAVACANPNVKTKAVR